MNLDPGGFNDYRMCRNGPMIFNKHDLFIGRSLQKYGEFSYGEQILFDYLVRPGQLVVEVGANIGSHTVHLSKLVGPGGQVHAFEPQRLVFQVLCGNVAINQCVNTFTYQAAIGTERGKINVPVLDPQTDYNFAAFSLHKGYDFGEQVPIYPLDDLDLPACHFLKADVEDMEVEVVKGSARTIDMYRPVMYLENEREARYKELLELVLGMDYKIFWHATMMFNPENFAGDRENVFPQVASFNILCVPNETRFDNPGLKQVTSSSDTWMTAGWQILGPNNYRRS